MKSTEIGKSYQVLVDSGYINYGTLIPTDVMEKIIGEKFSEEWSFLGPLLAIRKHIEDNGYICTQRGQEDGSLKLVGIDEFAHYATNNFNKAMGKMKRLQKCVLHAKKDEFDSKNFKEYLHASNKISSSLNAMKSVLNSI